MKALFGAVDVLKYVGLERGHAMWDAKCEVELGSGISPLPILGEPLRPPAPKQERV